MTKAAAVQAKMAAAPRRGLGHVEAAIYVGISPTKFTDLVREGKMPRPRLLDGRRIWEAHEFERQGIKGVAGFVLSRFGRLPEEAKGVAFEPHITGDRYWTRNYG